MFYRLTQVATVISITLMSIACQAQGSASPAPAPATSETLSPDQVLTLGDVSGNPAGTIEEFQPLADYLADHLADAGIRKGKVVVASDLATMKNYLKTGQVDLYFDSPYPALEVYEEIGAYPLVRRWKGGVSEYHTLIVVRQDSGITDLDGLLGHILAFDHPASTSGYLLPKAHLALNGYQVVEKSDTSSVADDGEIGYVFAFGDENVVTWVLQGKTGGAAIPNGDYEGLETDVQDQLTILARTPSVPRHIVMASPGMGETLRAQIIKLLLNLDEASKGPEILATFEGTVQFDPLPQGPEGTMKALQELFSPVR